MYPPFGPILFQLGPFSIHWYGLIMTTAIFLGTFTASRYVASRGKDPNTVWEMLFWVLIPAIVGARLYYVFIQSGRVPFYLSHPFEILAVWHGGIHIYGALILGGLTLLIYMRARKLSFPVYLDGIGLGLLVGQIIGRLGNFMNQELYGPPTTLPWGLRIDAQHRIPPYNDMTRYPDSVRFQPLFLYEMIWNSIGLVLLLIIARRFSKRLRAGDLFLLYLIWAPLGRFWLEFMRTDSWFFPGTPFNVVHILAAIAIITSAILLFVRHRHPARTEEQSTEAADDTERQTTSPLPTPPSDAGTPAGDDPLGARPLGMEG
jgi:phosphatidylglycerol:prolipoprotein diacylglycerol transferase